MSQAIVHTYAAPRVILLAMDWSEGAGRSDFLGFAIHRRPGFRVRGQQAAEDWLPNRICFDGPSPDHRDFPSNRCPIQKFMWWDARIDDEDEGKTLTYVVTPVTGTSDDPQLVEADQVSVDVTVPPPVVDGIGTYFNRAVVSSQAFTKKFDGPLKAERLQEALTWLANGLQDVVPGFVKGAGNVDGAIYHLSDNLWVLPALKRLKRGSLVYFWKDPTAKTAGDQTNRAAVRQLKQFTRSRRTKANIMHDKMLVRTAAGAAKSVLMGSANFTTEGLTAQANLLHTFDSPELASLYLDRVQLLQANPSVKSLASQAGWSKPVAVGDASIRVFFPPEPTGDRASLDRIVKAVSRARRSVLFCVFTPTDRDLLDACFAAGGGGKMMFGLVNSIGKPKPNPAIPAASDVVARTLIYHRSRANRDVYSHALFAAGDVPAGFLPEVPTVGAKAKFPVYIHHKFVVIDAETDSPTIYTGSANMSGNSVWHNDENLMEISGSPRLAHIYLAEFMRLYEHYRARAQWRAWKKGRPESFQLEKGSGWATDDFTRGDPKYKSRRSMTGQPLK